MRHLLILALGLLFLGCQSDSSSKDSVSPPTNILFIMSDDHAEKAISAYGHNLLQTPNIDRLAKEGMLFRNSFVTNSICAPSRAVLLTGMYSHMNGLRDNRDTFDGSQLTVPKILREAGYQTGMIGKWHLKTTPTGFDRFNILIGQGSYYNPVMVAGGDTTKHTGYTTELITDFALDFLEERDTTKPFFLIYNHKAPHRNWMPNTKDLDMFKGVDIPLPDNFYDDYNGREAAGHQDMRITDMYLSGDLKIHLDSTESDGTGGNGRHNPIRSWQRTYGDLTAEQKSAWDAHYDSINTDFRTQNLTGKAKAEWMYQRYMQDYLASVHSVDENIGRVLDYLDENGLTENTLVVYTSDQGFYLGEHGWYDKRFMYEESLSMPLIMRLPGLTHPGTENQDIVLNLDFAPTLLDVAGIETTPLMQGESLVPLLGQEEVLAWRKSMYYHYYEYPHGWHMVRKHNGVRTDRYKLIHYYDDPQTWELFDLDEDPNEMNNLYGKDGLQELQIELHDELNRLVQFYGDQSFVIGEEPE